MTVAAPGRTGRSQSWFYPGLRRTRDAAANRLDDARTTHIAMLGLPEDAANYRARVLEQTSVTIDPGQLHRHAVASACELKS